MAYWSRSMSFKGFNMGLLSQTVNAVVSGLLLFSFSSIKGETLFMSSLCEQTLNMADRLLDEAMLELTSQSEYWSNLNCKVNVLTSKEHKLSFTILEMNLEDCNDTLILYGESTNTPDIIYKTTDCSSTSHVYTTLGPSGIVSFSVDSAVKRRGFTILITSFFIGECPSDYFECTNNRCIKSGLTCNTRDNCGDKSDEYDKCNDSDDDDEDEFPWYAILLIVLGCGAVIFFYAYLKKKKARAARTAPTQTSSIKTSKAAKNKKESDQSGRSATDNSPISRGTVSHGRDIIHSKTSTSAQQPGDSSEVSLSTNSASREAVPPAITIYPLAAPGRLPPIQPTHQSGVPEVPPPSYEDVMYSDLALANPALQTNYIPSSLPQGSSHLLPATYIAPQRY